MTNLLLARIRFFCTIQVLFCSFQLVLESRCLFEAAVYYYTNSEWRWGRYWKFSLRLSGIVIWHLKDDGVTTLIFQGHMTSSDMWPFDSWGQLPIGGPLW